MSDNNTVESKVEANVEVNLDEIFNGAPTASEVTVPAEGAETATKDGDVAKKDDKPKEGADKKPDEKKPAEKKPAEKK